MDQIQPLCLILAVWNDAYVDLFLNYALPSQLASGNLDSLNNPNDVYSIFTREQDKQRIEAHPLFNKLSNLVKVRFVLVDETIKDNRLRAGYCFGLGVEYAKSINGIVVLVMPDVMYSSGSFKYMQQKLRDGYRAILLACHTSETNKALPLLDGRKDNTGILNLTGRDYNDILLQSMHNNSREKFFNDGSGNLMPASMCWHVGNQGILTHAFHLTPLAVDPSGLDQQFFGTIDREFIQDAGIKPAEIYVVQDSDNCAMFEVAAATHIIAATYRKGNADDIIDWAIMHANAQHRAMLQYPIYLKSSNYVNDSEWLQVETRAKAVIDYVEQVLLQKKSLAHYLKFRYAYIRKLILTAHANEWQKKKYSWKPLGKMIVASHNLYLKFAVWFAAVQDKQRETQSQKIQNLSQKYLNANLPVPQIVSRLEQWNLKQKSPMLVQLLLKPITLPAMWLAINYATFMGNTMAGSIKVARN